MSFQGKMAFTRLDERKTERLIVNTVTESLERQLWVVTKAYGDNYYDIQKGSSFVLNFDFNTGKLQPTGNYTDGNQLRHLRCWNATGSAKLVVGTTVRIAYRNHNVTQKPYIKSVYNMPFGQKLDLDEVPAIIAYVPGRWDQIWGNAYLNSYAWSLLFDQFEDTISFSYSMDPSDALSTFKVLPLAITESVDGLVWLTVREMYPEDARTTDNFWQGLRVYLLSPNIGFWTTKAELFIPFTLPYEKFLSQASPGTLVFSHNAQRQLIILPNQVTKQGAGNTGNEGIYNTVDFYTVEANEALTELTCVVSRPEFTQHPDDPGILNDKVAINMNVVGNYALRCSYTGGNDFESVVGFSKNSDNQWIKAWDNPLSGLKPDNDPDSWVVSSSNKISFPWNNGDFYIQSFRNKTDSGTQTGVVESDVYLRLFSQSGAGQGELNEHLTHINTNYGLGNSGMLKLESAISEAAEAARIETESLNPWGTTTYTPRTANEGSPGSEISYNDEHEYIWVGPAYDYYTGEILTAGSSAGTNFLATFPLPNGENDILTPPGSGRYAGLPGSVPNLLDLDNRAYWQPGGSCAGITTTRGFYFSAVLEGTPIYATNNTYLKYRIFDRAASTWIGQYACNEDDNPSPDPDLVACPSGIDSPAWFQGANDHRVTYGIYYPATKTVFETVLLMMSPNGDVQKYTLSQRFTGTTSDGYAVSEELPVPENCWQIIAIEHPGYLVVLADWRSAVDAQPQPRIFVFRYSENAGQDTVPLTLLYEIPVTDFIKPSDEEIELYFPEDFTSIIEVFDSDQTYTNEDDEEVVWAKAGDFKYNMHGKEYKNPPLVKAFQRGETFPGGASLVGVTLAIGWELVQKVSPAAGTPVRTHYGLNFIELTDETYSINEDFKRQYAFDDDTMPEVKSDPYKGTGWVKNMCILNGRYLYPAESEGSQPALKAFRDSNTDGPRP